jgi:predicted flap endonuclease-1-like 5' DNA nuclease
MDAKNRAKELSAALQEAFERRDELQREIKDIRSNLEVSLSERERLQSDMATRGSNEDLLRQKDEHIAKLTRDLENWQSRVPPLVERFRTRNEEATRLEAELARANDRIRELEHEQAAALADQTRIEPVHHPEELTDGLDASNDPDEEGLEEFVDSLAEGLGDVAEAVADVGAELRDEPELDDEPEAQDEPEAGEASEADLELAASEEADATDGRDDLKRIKGIGPAIEKTLNELGVFSFRQIADMSEYDIDRVARKLKGFHSRIYREDWIGQARELLGRAIRA